MTCSRLSNSHRSITARYTCDRQPSTHTMLARQAAALAPRLAVRTEAVLGTRSMSAMGGLKGESGRPNGLCARVSALARAAHRAAAPPACRI